MSHKRDKPLFVVRKFLRPHPPEYQAANLPTLQSLDYVWGTVERETNESSYNTKGELKARITVVFTNLNREIVRKAWRRFRSCLEAKTEANDEFFE